MGYGILEKVSLFFFILVLLSVFHDFLSLSVSESFALVAGEGLRYPGAKGVVLIKRTAVELFNIIAGDGSSISVVDLNTHVLTVMTDHNIIGFSIRAVILLLNLKSIFTAQVVAVMSNAH